MKLRTLLLILCLACLPASVVALRYVHGWTALFNEDVGKSLYSEDPSQAPSEGARLAAYASAAPSYLFFTVPVLVGAITPVVVCGLLLFQVGRSPRVWRAAGWPMFGCLVALSGLLTFIGVVSVAHGGALLLLAFLLAVVAISPIIPTNAKRPLESGRYR